MAGVLPLARRKNDTPIDGLMQAVHQCADGLCYSRIEQVGADRGAGCDVEQQDEQGRHQRAAADAGLTNQEPDQKARQDVKGIHGAEHTSADRPEDAG